MSTQCLRRFAAPRGIVCLLSAVQWISAAVCPLMAETPEPGAPDWVPYFMQVVNARGKDCHIPAHAARLVGLAQNDVPDREIDVWGRETRAIGVLEVNGETSMLVIHKAANDIWWIRLSDTGEIERAIWVTEGQGVHHVTDQQAADQLEAEELYWNKWAARRR